MWVVWETLVVRKPGSRTKLRAELFRRLPFEAQVVLCDGRDLIRLKKYGCRTYVYQGRPHYYYQDEWGRIIVRRPIIEVHGGVVIH